MSLTFNSAFAQALTMLGVLDPDDTPSTSQSDNGLLVANNLTQNLSLERPNCAYIVVAAANLTSGNAAYTFGPAGSFGTTRYVKLVDAGIRVPNSLGTGTLRSPCRVVGENEFQLKFDKQAASTAPEIIWYDQAYPTATGRLWPTPTFSGGNVQLEVEAWAVLTSFADKTTAIDLPYGFDRPYIALLAKDLMSTYSVRPELIPGIASAADSALAAWRAVNMAPANALPNAGPVNAIAPAPVSVQ